MNGQEQQGEVGGMAFGGELSMQVIRGNATPLRRIIDYFILFFRRITYLTRSISS